MASDIFYSLTMVSCKNAPPRIEGHNDNLTMPSDSFHAYVRVGDMTLSLHGVTISHLRKLRADLTLLIDEIEFHQLRLKEEDCKHGKQPGNPISSADAADTSQAEPAGDSGLRPTSTNGD